MSNEQQKGKQMRFTDEELNLIRNTFKDNDNLLLLMRKVFLPELDPKAPLGQMIDVYMTINTKELTPEQIAISVEARNLLIGHVEIQLKQLQLLAMTDTPEDALERLKKNSSK